MNFDILSEIGIIFVLNFSFTYIFKIPKKQSPIIGGKRQTLGLV